MTPDLHLFIDGLTRFRIRVCVLSRKGNDGLHLRFSRIRFCGDRFVLWAIFPGLLTRIRVWCRGRFFLLQGHINIHGICFFQ